MPPGRRLAPGTGRKRTPTSRRLAAGKGAAAICPTPTRSQSCRGRAEPKFQRRARPSHGNRTRSFCRAHRGETGRRRHSALLRAEAQSFNRIRACSRESGGRCSPPPPPHRTATRRQGLPRADQRTLSSAPNAPDSGASDAHWSRNRFERRREKAAGRPALPRQAFPPWAALGRQRVEPLARATASITRSIFPDNSTKQVSAFASAVSSLASISSRVGFVISAPCIVITGVVVESVRAAGAGVSMIGSDSSD